MGCCLWRGVRVGGARGVASVGGVCQYLRSSRVI